MQYVKVDLGGPHFYTYAWSGKTALQPGDIVQVPGNVVNPDPQPGRVRRLLDAPDYDGKIVEILRAKRPR